MVLIKSIFTFYNRPQKFKFISLPLCVQIRNKSGTASLLKKPWFKSCNDSPGVISSLVEIGPVYNQTIPEFVFQHLHKWENKTAFECGVTGRKYTHKELYKNSKSFAVALKELGLKMKESACILLPNIPEYPIAALGIWDAGLIVSPINSLYTANEIAHYIINCDARVIITIPELLPIVDKVKKNCPSLCNTVVVGSPHDGCHSFFEMIKTDTSNTKLLEGCDINSLQETAVLFSSSGTTGPPKAVEQTHSSVITNLQQITFPGFRQTEFADSSNGQERFIALVPFFHLYGFQIIMANAIYQGSHVLCLPKFEPGLFVRSIKQHRPTVMHLVPPLINFIIESKDITAEDLRETKGTIAGAAPIGETLINKFIERFDHNLFFQEGYGMTEIGVSHLIPLEMKNAKAGSSGVLMPGISSKIVDTDSGLTVGPNVPGEICVRGPQTMKAYFKNEDATNETIDKSGFLKTGDLGFYDDQGFLYIVDRLKELIKVKGLQVAPAELENILRQHPDISDVGVIGINHGKLGEAPRAYVVPKSKTLTEADVKKIVELNAAPHKRLVGGVEFVQEIPKAASGKILRRVLKDAYNAKC